MARVRVTLDDALVAECQELTGIASREALVEHALRELLRREHRKMILDLKGKVLWVGDLEQWRMTRKA